MTLALLLATCDSSSDVDSPQDAVSAADTTPRADAAPDVPSEDVSIADLPPELPQEWPTPPDFVGGDRPATWYVPADYTPDRKWPLVILLHGFSVAGFLQDALFQLSGQVDDRGFLLVIPDGTPNEDGDRFWNATDACCNEYGSDVDDVAYLLSLLDEMALYFRVDPKRVYLMGHSNGGFMSYRMACDAGDRITAIVSLAGADWLDPANCTAAHPVGVLQVHGTLDDVIGYEGWAGASDGGHHYAGYPSAEASAEGWAQRDGCAAPQVGAPFDMEPDLPGPETNPTEWSDCTDGLRVALWTIEDGTHIPNVYDGTFTRLALDFLFSQTRP